MEYSLIIADDDELIRKGIEQVIPWTELGFVVRGVFANGRDALNFYRQNPTAVILTDVKMPELSGLELIEEAKRINPSLKAVIISGFDEFDLVKSALTLKVEDYLLKPLSLKSIEELFTKLHKELEEESLRSDVQSGIQTCYLLCRELYSNAKSFYVSVCHIEERRLLLISYPDDNRKAEETITSIFESSFVKSRCGYSVVLCPDESCKGKVEALVTFFLDEGISDYRIAVGSSVAYVDDIIAAFWRTYEILEGMNSGTTVCYSNSQSEMISDFVAAERQNLISAIEKGEDTSDEIRRIIEGARAMTADDQIFVFSALINKVARYFAVEDDEMYSFTLASADFAGIAKDDIPDAFIKDMERLTAVISSQSCVRVKILVDNVKRIVNENYDDPNLNLSAIADKLEVSYGYLSSIFSKTTGRKFKSYVIDVRLEKARELLLTRKYKVYEIADKTGYSNLKYFTESFHKKYGSSPVDYIRNLHKNS